MRPSLESTQSYQHFLLVARQLNLQSINTQSHRLSKGVKLHIVAWINWHKKAEKLELCHNKEDFVIKPKRPPKPRKSKYQSKEEYQAQIEMWEADLSHEKEDKPNGNAMTQKYYYERFLPVYIKATHKAHL